MVLNGVRVAGLCGGALLLGGCPPPDGYVESTPPPEYSADSSGPALAPAGDDAPPPRPPAEPAMEIEEPVSSGSMDLPALSDVAIVRKNRAEGPSVITVESAEIPDNPTKITDPAAAERLFRNSGITLQWIGWEQRGQVFIAIDGKGVWWVTAGQRGQSGGGLKLEGTISEIGSDYFVFDGEITIAGSPDADRFCDQNKQWRFAITQNRKYWRLREFEWCDRLTDYIDIYF